MTDRERIDWLKNNQAIVHYQSHKLQWSVSSGKDFRLAAYGADIRTAIDSAAQNEPMDKGCYKGQ